MMFMVTGQAPEEVVYEMGAVVCNDFCNHQLRPCSCLRNVPRGL